MFHAATECHPYRSTLGFDLSIASVCFCLSVSSGLVKCEQMLGREFEVPFAAVQFSKPHTHLRKKILRRLVFPGAEKMHIDKLLATLISNHSKPGEHSMLQLATERAATEQEGVNVNNVRNRLEHHHADQAVITKAVAGFQNERLKPARLRKVFKLAFRALDIREVKLVGPLR